MAIAYSSKTDSNNSTTTSHTVNLPSFSQDDYILIKFVGEIATSYVSGYPSGWDILARSWNSAATGFDAPITVLGRSMQSGDGSSVTITTAASMNSVATALKFTGVATTESIDTAGAMNTWYGINAAAIVEIPPVTTRTANTMVVAFAAAWNAGNEGTWTPPSGFTEAADYNNGTGCSVTAAYKAQSTAGSTGDLEFVSSVWDTVQPYGAIAVALRDTGSSTTVPPLRVDLTDSTQGTEILRTAKNPGGTTWAPSADGGEAFCVAQGVAPSISADRG